LSKFESLVYSNICSAEEEIVAESEELKRQGDGRRFPAALRFPDIDAAVSCSPCVRCL